MGRTTHRYGAHHSNVAELWRPDDVDVAPVVVLIHGGFWRGLYTKVLMNALAGSLVPLGWATWNVEYRRMGPLGGDGGWPETFQDVAAAIDYLEGVDGVDPNRVVTLGHSAGGTLALWAAGRHRLRDDSPGAAVKVPVRAAVSLAGVVDLDAADELGLGKDAASRLLGGHHGQHQDRYLQASPRALLPLGVPQVVVHGDEDNVVPPSMSEEYQRRATAAGDTVTYLPLPGIGHRELIDPDSKASVIVRDALEAIRAGWRTPR